MSSNNKTLPASQATSVGKEQQKIIADLTKRFNIEIGKSAQTIIAIASIVNDADQMIKSRDRYLQWLKGDCKMSESKGSKYLSIHRNPLLHDPKFYMQLPPEMSLWYLLSRLKTKKLFEAGVKYVLDHDPTYADLDVFVSGLLGKPKEKKHTLIRPRKGVVVNRKDIAAAVKEQTAEAIKKAADAKEEAKRAKAEAASAKKELAEIKKLEATLGKAKRMKRADEPTPGQIREAQEFDYDDGGNLVRIEMFQMKYTEIQKKKLQRKEVQKKIAEVLHAQGLHHVEATIRDRQSMPRGLAA